MMIVHNAQPVNNNGLDIEAAGNGLPQHVDVPPEVEFALATHALLIENPNDLEGLRGLSQLLAKKGEFRGAMSMLKQAIAITENDPTLYYELAVCAEKKKATLEGLCAIRKSIALNPNSGAAYLVLGKLLAAEGEIDLSLAAYDKALKLNGEKIEIFIAMAMARNKRGDFAEAEELTRKVLALAPDHIGAHFILSEAICFQGNFDEAGAVLDHIEGHQGTLAYDLKYRRAQIALSANDIEKTLALSQQVLQSTPEHAASHFLIGWCLLAKGRYPEGWEGYEWRFKINDASAAQYDPTRFVHGPPGLLWEGDALENRTLLIASEQAFGDNIQFIRLAAIVKRMAKCRVIFMVPPELVNLMKNVSFLDKVVAVGSPLPRHDYAISLCSLPAALKLRVEDIPGEPYIKAIPPAGSELNLDPKARLRVGIAWQGRWYGSHDQRGIPFQFFESLFDLKGVSFYSLQVGVRAYDIQESLNRENVYDWSDVLKTYEHTAYAISKLDLLITLDSSVAHLAGALGARTWTLLAFESDWRWFTNDKNQPYFETSPWYPSMRLFRQPSFKNWEDVFKNIKSELSKLAAHPANSLAAVK